VHPAAPVESDLAVISDPPLRRTSKQLASEQAPGERVEYAKDVVSGPVVENGRVRAREDVSGGSFLGSDVRRL
jgi:hypothetical protein